MKFKIKGDYFNNEFFLDLDKADETIEKTCPADLDSKLWIAPVKFENVEKVLTSAHSGFQVWKKYSYTQRADFIKKYHEALLKRKDEIAIAIALETGKPIWDAKGEVSGVLNKVSITLDESLKRIETKNFSEISPQTDGRWFYRPIGPCLIIGPFNFPCHLAGGQMLASLIAGNSIVFKPSEKTIYSAQLLIECFHEAQFPKGVINFINGGGEIATRLVKDKRIKGIFFTGSKEVGQKILSQTHQDLSKLVALELGGKNTSIIHQDANLDHALIELIQACFLTSGQRCTSTSVIAIHRNIYHEFTDRFHQLAKRIIIDHPIEHKDVPFMGPLIDDRAQNNYLNFIGMAKREGAEEIMRGKTLTKNHKGYYVSPSINLFEKINHKSIFLQSEIFGPAVSIIPYDNIEHASEIANMNEFGLASSVFTHDPSIMEYCLNSIEAGLININRSTVGASSKLPFGGIKSSGNYRPAAVTMIDACAYPVASLHLKTDHRKDEDLIGLMK